jgi:hypothetical protein
LPLLELTVLISVAVLTFRALIFAFGMTAPLLSVIRPVMVPVVVCATAGDVAKSNPSRSTKKQNEEVRDPTFPSLR